MHHPSSRDTPLYCTHPLRCATVQCLRHVLGCPDRKAVGCNCAVGRRRSFTTACLPACMLLASNSLLILRLPVIFLPSLSWVGVYDICVYSIQLSMSAVVVCLSLANLHYLLAARPYCWPSLTKLCLIACTRHHHHHHHLPHHACLLVLPATLSRTHSSGILAHHRQQGVLSSILAHPHTSITPFASFTSPSITTSIQPLHASFPFPYIGLFRFLACGELTVGSKSPTNAVITPNPARAIAP